MNLPSITKQLNQFPLWLNKNNLNKYFRNDQILGRIRDNFTTEIIDNYQCFFSSKDYLNGAKNFKFHLHIPDGITTEQIIMLGKELKERFDDVYVEVQWKNDISCLTSKLIDISEYDPMSQTQPKYFEIRVNLDDNQNENKSGYHKYLQWCKQKSENHYDVWFVDINKKLTYYYSMKNGDCLEPIKNLDKYKHDLLTLNTHPIYQDEQMIVMVRYSTTLSRSDMELLTKSLLEFVNMK